MRLATKLLFLQAIFPPGFTALQQFGCLRVISLVHARGLKRSAEFREGGGLGAFAVEAA